MEFFTLTEKVLPVWLKSARVSRHEEKARWREGDGMVIEFGIGLVTT